MWEKIFNRHRRDRDEAGPQDPATKTKSQRQQEPDEEVDPLALETHSTMEEPPSQP